MGTNKAIIKGQPEASAADSSGGSDPADPRFRRSHTALHRALLNLLETREFEQITVREICKAAAVHYATFFRHFPSKEALLERIVSEEIARLIAASLPLQDAGNGLDAVLIMCRYIAENRAAWNTLINGGARNAVREEWLRQARQVSAQRAPYGTWLPAELGVICSVNLIVETVAWWLSQPARDWPADEIAAVLHRVISRSTLSPDE